MTFAQNMRLIAFALACVLAAPVAVPVAAQERYERRIEGYPQLILDRIKQRKARLEQLPKSFQGFQPELVVVKSGLRWKPGRKVTVAFEGGNVETHVKIQQAALIWSAYANIWFDFGFDAQTGKFRSFSKSDKSYKADIRISFRTGKDWGGWWSAVGVESLCPKLYKPGEPSMNLEAIGTETDDVILGVMLHEFGHAIGAQHEHQHPTQGCDAELRWENDAGYVPTWDKEGKLTADDMGRRPGVYSYMAEPPEEWDRDQVDHNIRQLTPQSAYEAGPYDRDSIMKYYFPADYFRRGKTSPCYTDTVANFLSVEDAVRVEKIYPWNEADIENILREREQTAKMLRALADQFPDQLDLQWAIAVLEE